MCGHYVPAPPLPLGGKSMKTSKTVGLKYVISKKYVSLSLVLKCKNKNNNIIVQIVT